MATLREELELTALSLWKAVKAKVIELADESAEAARRAAVNVQEVAEHVSDDLQQAAHDVGQQAEKTGEEVQKSTTRLEHMIDDRTRRLRDEAEHTSEQLGKRATELTDTVSDRAATIGEVVTERASDIRRQVEEQAAEVAETLRQQLEHQIDELRERLSDTPVAEVMPFIRPTPPRRESLSATWIVLGSVLGAIGGLLLLLPNMPRRGLLQVEQTDDAGVTPGREIVLRDSLQQAWSAVKPRNAVDRQLERGRTRVQHFAVPDPEPSAES